MATEFLHYIVCKGNIVVFDLTDLGDLSIAGTSRLSWSTLLRSSIGKALERGGLVIGWVRWHFAHFLYLSGRQLARR